MNNKLTIKEIRDGAKKYLVDIEDKSIKKEWPIAQVNFDDKGMKIDGIPFSQDAVKQMCNIMRLKSNFELYYETMEERDWNLVSNKIKEALGDLIIIAQYANSGAGEFIKEVYVKNTKRKKDEVRGFDFYFDTICDSLSESSIDFSLKSFKFDKSNYKFDVVLMDEDYNMDVFGDNTDLWKGGYCFTFSPTSFETSPYFERLVCSNGMRSKLHGFRSKIDQAKYNETKIGTLIKNSITGDGAYLDELVIANINHLKGNNISLQEFYEYRNFFTKGDMDDNPESFAVATRYFDDKVFFETYGINVTEKSNKWRSTANSGINAYDFFNLITWLGSHPEETNLTDEESIEIQIKASNLFAKMELDLEDIAEPKEVKYEKVPEMA